MYLLLTLWAQSESSGLYDQVLLGYPAKQTHVSYVPAWTMVLLDVLLIPPDMTYVYGHSFSSEVGLSIRKDTHAQTL
jgi:hypothetical protein